MSIGKDIKDALISLYNMQMDKNIADTQASTLATLQATPQYSIDLGERQGGWIDRRETDRAQHQVVWKEVLERDKQHIALYEPAMNEKISMYNECRNTENARDTSAYLTSVLDAYIQMYNISTHVLHNYNNTNN